MSNNTPIARVGIRRKEGNEWKSYSVFTVWSTQYDGLFNASLDKGSEKYPAMSLADAFRAFAGGASLEIRTGQRSPESRSGGNYDRASSRGYEDDGFGGPDDPF